MFAELDRVVLTTDLPEHHLKSGDIGTIVLTHRGGAGYSVEYFARVYPRPKQGEAIETGLFKRAAAFVRRATQTQPMTPIR